jgi:hypothetical protein
MRFCLSMAEVGSAKRVVLWLVCGIDLRGLEETSFVASTDAFTLRDMMDWIVDMSTKGIKGRQRMA